MEEVKSMINRGIRYLVRSNESTAGIIKRFGGIIFGLEDRNYSWWPYSSWPFVYRASDTILMCPNDPKNGIYPYGSHAQIAVEWNEKGTFPYPQFTDPLESRVPYTCGHRRSGHGL